MNYFEFLETLWLTLESTFLGRMLMLTSNISCVPDAVLMDLKALISFQPQENIITDNAVICHLPKYEGSYAYHFLLLWCWDTLSLMTTWAKHCSPEFFVMVRLWIPGFSNQVYTKRFLSFVALCWKLNPLTSFLGLSCFYDVLGLDRLGSKAFFLEVKWFCLGAF